MKTHTISTHQLADLHRAASGIYGIALTLEQLDILRDSVITECGGARQALAELDTPFMRGQLLSGAAALADAIKRDLGKIEADGLRAKAGQP